MKASMFPDAQKDAFSVTYMFMQTSHGISIGCVRE